MENLTTILWIAVLAILLFVVYKLLLRQTFHREIARVINSNLNSAQFSALHNAGNTPAMKAILTHQENEEDFGKFVAGLFDRTYFTRSNGNGNNGLYAVSSVKTDMDMRFASKGFEVDFGVKCLWRKEFKIGQIQWCEIHQFEAYSESHTLKNQKLFVIIGIGGLPYSPNEMYVVPFDRLKSPHITRNELREFRRIGVSYPFFMNPEMMKLS